MKTYRFFFFVNSFTPVFDSHHPHLIFPLQFNVSDCVNWGFFFCINMKRRSVKLIEINNFFHYIKADFFSHSYLILRFYNACTFWIYFNGLWYILANSTMTLYYCWGWHNARLQFFFKQFCECEKLLAKLQ